MSPDLDVARPTGSQPGLTGRLTTSGLGAISAAAAVTLMLSLPHSGNPGAVVDAMNQLPNLAGLDIVKAERTIAEISNHDILSLDAGTQRTDWVAWAQTRDWLAKVSTVPHVFSGSARTGADTTMVAPDHLPRDADPRDQWFWAPEWQAKEREADDDVVHGRYAVSEGAAAFLAELDS
jgi:hypothetical protein